MYTRHHCQIPGNKSKVGTHAGSRVQTTERLKWLHFETVARALKGCLAAIIGSRCTCCLLCQWMSQDGKLISMSFLLIRSDTRLATPIICTSPCQTESPLMTTHLLVCHSQSTFCPVICRHAAFSRWARASDQYLLLL